MSAPVSGLDATLNRIAAIESSMASLAARVSGRPTAATSSQFASTLSSLQPTAATAQNPVGTVNGVTYSAAAANVTGADVVAKAKTYLGVPYVYAGNDYNGVDCSGLVQQTYRSLGMELPRVSQDQQNVGTEVGSLANAQPGDVLCFGEPAYHVAIYLGNNKMIEAPQPGENVHISDVWATPSHIRRIVAAPSSGPVASGAVTLAPAVSVGGSYRSLFTSDESRYGLPSGLLAAVAQVESGGNAAAVSPAGALGLMQLMPGTAKSLGVDPLNPTQAVDGAARMLSSLLSKYNGSLTLALAAYNAGSGAVDSYGGVPPYNETQNYVVKVQQLMKAQL